MSDELFNQQNNLSINRNGGYYINGTSYDHATKLRVASAYLSAQRQCDGRPNISAIAKECGVNWHFVVKIEKELYSFGTALHPSDVRRNRNAPIGPGALTLDCYDKFIILQLCIEEPSRSLKSYRDWLYHFTGKIVDRSTIRRLFHSGFVYKASLVKPNLVPYDKFRPDNIVKADKYIRMIKLLNFKRLVFGDEKLLKGQELYNRKARINPMTGERPVLTVTPDFRNTHSITAFTSLTSPLPTWYRIHEGNNNAEQFSNDIDMALACGFLKAEDVLVLDNASYHSGKDNCVLGDWLWKKHGVFLLYLPARSPEWNPVELVWNVLVQRLRTLPMSDIKRRYKKNACAYAAADILDEITQEEVWSFYDKCYEYHDL
eukprot:scaffold33635_cov188-Skeletonema_dohrnii-CCMP3373.AAC.1